MMNSVPGSKSPKKSRSACDLDALEQEAYLTHKFLQEEQNEGTDSEPSPTPQLVTLKSFEVGKDPSRYESRVYVEQALNSSSKLNIFPKETQSPVAINHNQVYVALKTNNLVEHVEQLRLLEKKNSTQVTDSDALNQISNQAVQSEELVLADNISPLKATKPLSSFSDVTSMFEYIKTNLPEIAFNKENCQFIQTQIRVQPRLATQTLSETIAQNLKSLVSHVIGNYLASYICKFASDEQFTRILRVFQDLVPCVFEEYSAVRCLERMIPLVSTPQQLSCLNRIVESSFLFCCQSQNGIHILKCYIENIDLPWSTWLFELMLQKVVFICRNKYSNTLIKSFLLFAEDEFIIKFVEEVVDNFFAIATDLHGNYAIITILTKLKSKTVYAYFAEKTVDRLEYFVRDDNGARILEELIVFEFENEESFVKQNLIKSQILPVMLFGKNSFYAMVKLVCCSSETEIEAIYAAFSEYKTNCNDLKEFEAKEKDLRKKVQEKNSDVRA